MKKILWMILPAFALAFSPGCRQAMDEQNAAIEALPPFSGEFLNVVVEIPAGTNKKVEYNKETGEFETGRPEGRPRIIDFLPYPGNYGFIPGTYMDPGRGGDGDALDVLLIAESLPSGTVLRARPIAALLLKDEGQADTKIIAVPADSSLQVMKAGDFQSFSIEYDGARHIIENWFLYYDGLGTNEFLGWEDETYALKEVQKWAKKERAPGRPEK